MTMDIKKENYTITVEYGSKSWTQRPVLLTDEERDELEAMVESLCKGEATFFSIRVDDDTQVFFTKTMIMKCVFTVNKVKA